MIRNRSALAVICAVTMLAGACGNSPPRGRVAPAPSTTTTTTTAPAIVDDEPEPDGSEAEEPRTSTTEPDTEARAPKPGTEARAPKPGTAPEAPETTIEFEEPTGANPIDSYPHRHEFVALEGVPGVTDDEIRVSVVGTRTNNPLGNCVLDCFVTGIQSYFDHVNDSGGVYGRQLAIGTVLDDELGFNLLRNIEMIADDDTLATFQATLFPVGWDELRDAGIPTFVWNIDGSRAVNRDNIFSNFVIGCADCTSRGLPWLVSQAGGTRVASLGYGISPVSKTCARAFADAVELYGADLGIEVAYFNDTVAFGLPNGVGPEVTQMVDAGADFIVTCMDLNAMLTLAQELERQGVRDQITMLHPNSYDTDFVAEAGSLFDGDYVLVLFGAFEYDIDSYLRDAYHRSVAANEGPESEQTMVGWINADMFVTGLLEAGPSFDRPSIIDSLNQITYGADGLINPIDWSRQHEAAAQDEPDHKYEQECVSYVRMEDGEFVGFQPAPWMCWPNDVQGWLEPTPTDFSS